MKNRKLLLIVSLALAMMMSLGGTLAYLTDTDADVNTMVLGNVHIVQNEQQRVKNGDTYTSVLEAFKDGQTMLPAVHDRVDANGNTVPDPARMVLDVNGYQLKKDVGLRSFPNYMDKIVSVTNKGKTDAYVRTIIAVPAGINENDPDNDGVVHDQWLHYNFVSDNDTVPNNGWHYGTPQNRIEYNKNFVDNHYYFEDVELNGAKYDISIVTNTKVIKPQETTGPNLVGLYLDNDVNFDGTSYTAKGTDGKPVVVWNQPELKVYVLSQAVQANGFDDAWTAFENAFSLGNDPKAKLVEWFTGIEENVETTGPDNMPEVFYNGDVEALQRLLSGAGMAGAGNTTITLTENYDFTGKDWTPVYVDGYNGADIITIEGNGHVIKGLNAPLFHGGFAGGSGIIINDLTIQDSEMVSTNATGSGAFIEYIDSMDIITLKNCHLKNSSITGSRTGGLIGYTAGYNKVTDGPVKTNVTIENCSVIGNTITGSAVGGVNGHAGANPWTFTTIKDCVVKDNELISTDTGDWRVGVVVGTANVGEVTISNITESGNTLTQTGKTAPEGQSNLYGRFVPGSTGTLTIDGVEIN